MNLSLHKNTHNSPPHHLNIVNKSIRVNIKTLIFCIFLAILTHIIILIILYNSTNNNHLIQVINTFPQPNQELSLPPDKALIPNITLNLPPNIKIDLSQISLYEVDDNGYEHFVSNPRINPEKHNQLLFPPITKSAKYRFHIPDSNNLLQAPYRLDGESNPSFPSGNNIAGTDYSATFTISKPEQIFTASLYNPQKPQINEEKPQPQETTPPPRENPPPPQKTTKPKTTAKTTTPPQTPPDPSPTPPPPAPPMPSPTTPPPLKIDPNTFNKLFATKVEEFAQQQFEKADTNYRIQRANTTRQRVNNAYNPQGPTVKIGQQGNAVQNQKNVSEYIALMHKEIHQRWAWTYLVYLDTALNNFNDPLNNPNLQTILEITMNNKGQIKDVKMVSTSGNINFDSEAINVAWNASPHISPPSEMRSANGNSYIHWTFWRDLRQCGVFGVKVFKLDGSSLNLDLNTIKKHEKKWGLDTHNPQKQPPQKTTTQPQNNTKPTTKISPLDDL